MKLTSNRNVYPFTDSDLDAEYEYDGTSVLYAGKAQPGAKKGETKWQIKKFFYSSGLVTSIKFADGTNDYSKKWDDRATYDYDPES